MLATIATVAVISTAVLFVMAALDQGAWNSPGFDGIFVLTGTIWFLSVIATAIGLIWRFLG